MLIGEAPKVDFLFQKLMKFKQHQLQENIQDQVYNKNVISIYSHGHKGISSRNPKRSFFLS